MPRHNTIAALMVMASVFACAFLLAPRFGLGVAAAFAATYVLLGFVIWFFMRLVPAVAS